jgi:hypothetical protein
MDTKVEPTLAIKKSNYFNCIDEVHGHLCMPLSHDLWYHVDACKTPNEIWTTLDSLFGKKYAMRGHILKLELNSLDPKRFDNIQDFFTKFKCLLL